MFAGLVRFPVNKVHEFTPADDVRENNAVMYRNHKGSPLS